MGRRKLMGFAEIRKTLQEARMKTKPFKIIYVDGFFEIPAHRSQTLYVEQEGEYLHVRGPGWKEWLLAGQAIQGIWEVDPRGRTVQHRNMLAECFQARTGLPVDWNTGLVFWARRKIKGQWSAWYSDC